MVDINGYEIKSAFSGGEPLKAIYSLGVKVWPTGPVEFGGLKFTALKDGNISMNHYGTNSNTKPNLSYSKNGGSWVEWDYTPISVVTDDVVYFKGINDKISSSYSDYSKFTSTGKFTSSGNIMSLLYGDDYEGKLSLSGKGYCFYKLFGSCHSLISAQELKLSATTLSEGCYSNMFYYCTSLTSSPSLPAKTLATRCYEYMFQDCSKLTTAPSLPATSLADYCYSNMFLNCDALNTAPKLPATALAYRCYEYMFYQCISLTTAPKLPAGILKNYCYDNMFYSCSSLTNAPELPATILQKGCYNEMFQDCIRLKYVKANFTTKPSDDYTYNWLDGVASLGTFQAHSTADWVMSVKRGPSTVPSGWTLKRGTLTIPEN